MKAVCIYVSAFVLGLLCMRAGFYLVPIYEYRLPGHFIFGPILVVFAGFLFGVPPVSIFLKLVLKSTWKRAIYIGVTIVLVNIFVLAGVAYLFLHSYGKL